MPGTFGKLLTTDELPYWELTGWCSSGAAIAPGGNTILTWGNVTMPWDGQLFASLNAVFSTPGYQQATVNLAQSTPAPTWSSNLTHINGSGGPYLRGQIPIYASWDGLVKGQVVTLKPWCQVGSGATAVTFELIYGAVRAVRGGP